MVACKQGQQAHAVSFCGVSSWSPSRFTPSSTATCRKWSKLRRWFLMPNTQKVPWLLVSLRFSRVSPLASPSVRVHPEFRCPAGFNVLFEVGRPHWRVPDVIGKRSHGIAPRSCCWPQSCPGYARITELRVWRLANEAVWWVCRSLMTHVSNELGSGVCDMLVTCSCAENPVP